MWPKTLKKTESPISGSIKVVSLFNKPRIIVGNMVQSGGMVEAIWKKGIGKLLEIEKDKGFKLEKVLILGLGGGTATKLISYTFPKAEIVGIEIDPIILKLGKKYFDLNKIKKLKIINQDGVELVLNNKLKKVFFDLILVDLYIGDKIPKKSQSELFLNKLKRLIDKEGIIIFNRLFFKEHKKKTESFIKKLDKIFSNISLLRAYSNLLVYTVK